MTSVVAPDIDAAAEGSFVVVWIDTSTGIHARCYASDGTPFTASTTTIGTQMSPDIATSNDRFVVVRDGMAAGGETDGAGVARRLYRRRSVFADDFESGDDAGWRAAVP